MSESSVESLFRDVENVKDKLQEFKFENSVDVNEIYETLETHSNRKDRVTFVVSLILNKFGVNVKNEVSHVISGDKEQVTNAFDLSQIDDPNTPATKYCGDIQEVVDDSQKTTQEYEVDSQESDSQVKTQDYELDDSEVLVVESDPDVCNSSVNTSVASLRSLAEASVASFSSQVSVASSSSQASVAKSLVQVPIAGCSSTRNSVIQKAEPVSCKAPTSFQLPQTPQVFPNDLNNNDPNNNTMYSQDFDRGLEVEMEKTNDSEDTYDFEDISFNQEVIRQTLLEDTRTVHSIFPHHSFEQIYAYLEANTDNPDRINVVTQIFLNMETNNVESKKDNGIVNEDAPVHEKTVKSDSSKVGEKINGNIELEAHKVTSEAIPIVIDVDHEGGTLKRQSPPVHEVPVKKSKKSEKDVKGVPTVIILDEDSGSNNITVIGHNSGESSKSEQTVNREVFNTIKEMFPAIDHDYLKTTCLKYSAGNFMNTVNEIATFLLEQPNPPKNPNYHTKSDIRVKSPEELNKKANKPLNLVKSIKEVVQKVDQPVPVVKTEESAEAVDPIELQIDAIEDETAKREDALEQRYQYLLDVFPGADPTYLRNKCEEIGEDDERMREFISHSLEHKDYPTYESYCKRQKKVDMYKKFTENFSVENFLELFPDPVSHFENIGKTEDSTRAYTYLKNKFRHIRCSEISSVFNKHKQNLAKTCRTLASHKSRMKVLRPTIKENIVWDNCKITFVQEVAFVENREKIEEYLRNKQTARDAEFAKAKANGELLECGCCYGDEFLFEDMASCNDGHLFCKECVRKGAETAIGEGKVTFLCLTDCESEFSFKTLQAVLKPSVFSNLLQRKQLEEVKAAGIEGLESCPYCNFATIPPEEDKVFHCLNPDCMKETCRNCKEPNHIPLRCEEVEKSEEVRVRTMIEDRMTQALIRTCWKCKKTFVKEDGCNKMTCTCGAKMCYICRQPVQDYSHFNGQGGTEFHKCPLYSTNNELHVEAVKKAAKQAKDEVLAQNPSVALKNDPTKVLPKADPNQHHLPGIFHNNMNQIFGMQPFIGLNPIPRLLIHGAVLQGDNVGRRNDNAGGNHLGPAGLVLLRRRHGAHRARHFRERLAEYNGRRNRYHIAQGHAGNQGNVDAGVGIMINVYPHQHQHRVAQIPENVPDLQPINNEIFDDFAPVQHNIRMVDNFGPMQHNDVIDNNIDPLRPNNMMDNNFMQHNNLMDNLDPFQPNNELGNNLDPMQPNEAMPHAPLPLAVPQHRPFAPVPPPIPAVPAVEQGLRDLRMYQALRPARNRAAAFHRNDLANINPQYFAPDILPAPHNMHRCMPNMGHNQEVQAQNVPFDEARAPVDLTYRPEDLTYRPHGRPGRLAYQNAFHRCQQAQAVGNAPAAGPLRRDQLRQALHLAMTANNQDRQAQQYEAANGQSGTRIVLEVTPAAARQQEDQRNQNFPREENAETMFLNDSDDDD